MQIKIELVLNMRTKSSWVKFRFGINFYVFHAEIWQSE